MDFGAIKIAESLDYFNWWRGLEEGDEGLSFVVVGDGMMGSMYVVREPNHFRVLCDSSKNDNVAHPSGPHPNRPSKMGAATENGVSGNGPHLKFGTVSSPKPECHLFVPSFLYT